jgi:hypothetical protein
VTAMVMSMKAISRTIYSTVMGHTNIWMEMCMRAASSMVNDMALDGYSTLRATASRVRFILNH